MIKIPLDITCWYINARRIYELVGSKSMPTYPEESDFMRRQRSLRGLKSNGTETNAKKRIFF
jgi:hypothetical protein